MTHMAATKWSALAAKPAPKNGEKVVYVVGLSDHGGIRRLHTLEHIEAVGDEKGPAARHIMRTVLLGHAAAPLVPYHVATQGAGNDLVVMESEILRRYVVPAEGVTDGSRQGP